MTILDVVRPPVVGTPASTDGRSDVAIPAGRLDRYAGRSARRRRPGVLEYRLPHRAASVDQDGAGPVDCDEFWAAAVAGVPTDRAFQVIATPGPEDDRLGGAWRSMDLVVHPRAEVVSELVLDGVTVEGTHMLCAGLEALGEFSRHTSLDE